MYKSMATKKRGLGQGIDSLIPNKVNANKETETVKVNAGSEKNETDGTVSYTHLTLPTICSV